jgi:hypothetical protein
VSAETGLEHLQVKWIRFTVDNAAEPKTRADFMSVETALGCLRDRSRDDLGPDASGVRQYPILRCDFVVIRTVPFPF